MPLVNKVQYTPVSTFFMPDEQTAEAVRDKILHDVELLSVGKYPYYDWMMWNVVQLWEQVLLIHRVGQGMKGKALKQALRDARIRSMSWIFGRAVDSTSTLDDYEIMALFHWLRDGQSESGIRLDLSSVDAVLWVLQAAECGDARQATFAEW